MDKYAKWFIKAGLIYIVLGILVGIATAVEPALVARLRFLHIHFNLLGFMTMMIAGVAYHVLPRFNARPVPWPEGVKYHFILQNVGLIGMAATHVAGAMTRGGVLHLLFVIFSVTAGTGILIMFYNLYFVLAAPRVVERPSRITGDMKVGAVLDQFPEALPVFLQSGFSALANPAARKTFAQVVTIDKACEKHGVDPAGFLRTLNEVLFEKPGGPPSPPVPNKEETQAPGQVIHKGEMCQADTLVGSLIKVYPDTKPVFEKHYGEGCFSCPGQTFETVGQTAQMHNVDPALILKEINTVIEAELKKD